VQSHYRRLKIVSIIEETPVARTFILQALDDWKPAYSAGQFITLVFMKRGIEHRRSYSMSSAPFEGDGLSITVKKVDNGEFSRLLVYSSKPGDILYSSGIGGFFTLEKNVQEASKKHLFFLAASSGITPCYSMIKSSLRSSNDQITLIYSNRSEHDTIFLNQLKSLEREYSHQFKIIWLFSNVFDAQKSRLSSHLIHKILDSYDHSVLKHSIFYLCGPFGYMQMIEISLKTRGIDEKLIHKEQFGPLPRKIIPRPPDTREHKVHISMQGIEFDIYVQYPKSIVRTAREKGYVIPYSCVAGICGSCVATCISGKIWMAYNEVLTDDEIRRGRVLTCQGFPIDGDAEIIF